MAMTWLVTGASRGIGAEFCKQLLARGDRVIATVRKGGEELQRLGAGVRVLDVTDEKQLEGFGEAMRSEAVDVLINNAGVSSTQRTISELSGAELERSFRVNAIAPMLVAKAVLPSIRAGGRKLIVNVTSQLASIANNNGGSSYPYRASKTALNQLSVSLANELRPEKIAVLIMHPGWVRTDMGGPQAPLAATDAVAAMLRVIDGAGMDHSGRFLNFDGAGLPW